MRKQYPLYMDAIFLHLEEICASSTNLFFFENCVRETYVDFYKIYVNKADLAFFESYANAIGLGLLQPASVFERSPDLGFSKTSASFARLAFVE